MNTYSKVNWCFLAIWKFKFLGKDVLKINITSSIFLNYRFWYISFNTDITNLNKTITVRNIHSLTLQTGSRIQSVLYARGHQSSSFLLSVMRVKMLIIVDDPLPLPYLSDLSYSLPTCYWRAVLLQYKQPVHLENPGISDRNIAWE